MSLSEDMQGDCGAATRCLFCSFARVAHLHSHCPALLQAEATPHLARSHISEDVREEGGEEEEAQIEGIKAGGAHELVQSVLEANERKGAGKPYWNPSSLLHEPSSTFYSAQIHEDPLTVSNNLKLSTPFFFGERAFTYSEVLACVDALSLQLQKALLHPSEEGASSNALDDSVLLNSVKKVGIFISPSVEYVVAVLAVLKCGFVFVPLEPFWPAVRITDVIANANLCILLTSQSTSEAKIAAKYITCTIPIMLVDIVTPPTYRNTSHCMCFCHTNQERPYCYLLYTSGSSGKPKGVYGTEMGLLHRLQWMQREYSFLESDVAVFKASIAFVDHLTELFGPLLGGSLVIVPPAAELYRNPVGLLPFMQTYHVSRLTAVPSLMHSLLPILSRNSETHAFMSVKVLILSGEMLSYDLLESIQVLLPHTTVLNLYGCTELSGDCLCFDCGSLEKPWDNVSVPIGKPLPGCLIEVFSQDTDMGDEGELWVGGVLVALGYHRDPSGTENKFMKLPGSDAKTRKSCFFKTGDFVKKLKDGNLLFLGRRDRIIKVNGQKVSLDEIESILEAHPLVAQAAVSSRKAARSDGIIVTYVVIKQQESNNGKEVFKTSQGLANMSSVEDSEMLSCLKSWLGERLPLAMIPSQFTFLNSLPMISAGKKDYRALDMVDVNRVGLALVDPSEPQVSPLANHIRKAFEHVLKMDNVSIHNDFFSLGGTSVSAAHLAHILHIDMRLLYSHSSVMKLEPVIRALECEVTGSSASKLDEGSFGLRSSKGRKVNESLNTFLLGVSLYYDEESSFDFGSIWRAENWPCANIADPPLAFLRCNVCAPLNPSSRLPTTRMVHNVLLDSVATSKLCKLSILWKTELEACVDASPVLVRYTEGWRLFIGSHAHIFTCLDACSGNVIWERVLGDRVESTAALTSDFKQVVAGSYDGNVYFLESETGIVNWKFETKAEVKCQPTVGIWEGLVWCGSHDHHLYVLNAADQKCVWEHDCKGSIFGAAAHDLARCLTYVATTAGTIISFSTDGSHPRVAWVHVCEAPVFGSLALDAASGYVICALVNGGVLALMSSGSVAWRYTTGGPVFAGATLTSVLPSQVLICSRDGWVYSLHLKEGRCLWKYCLGEPIVSSAYVDEGLNLVFREPYDNKVYLHSFRLVCVCGSAGQVHILKVYAGTTSTNNALVKEGHNQRTFFQERRVMTTMKGEDMHDEGEHADNAEAVLAPEGERFKVDNGCELLTVLNLPGDVFSSPVMLGGRIFVGCRDNHLYCLKLCPLVFDGVKGPQWLASKRIAMHSKTYGKRESPSKNKRKKTGERESMSLSGVTNLGGCST